MRFEFLNLNFIEIPDNSIANYSQVIQYNRVIHNMKRHTRGDKKAR